MAQLLVAADGSPKDVVGDAVAVEEVDGRADLDRREMRLEDQTLSGRSRDAEWAREMSSLKSCQRKPRTARNSRDLSADGAGAGRQSKSSYDCDQDQNVAFHDFSLFQ